jgi:hypothetical protein
MLYLSVISYCTIEGNEQVIRMSLCSHVSLPKDLVGFWRKLVLGSTLKVADSVQHLHVAVYYSPPVQVKFKLNFVINY